MAILLRRLHSGENLYTRENLSAWMRDRIYSKLNAKLKLING